MQRSIEALTAERDRLQVLADRAAARVFSGQVKSSAYAQRLASALENAEGDLDRALHAAERAR